MNILSTIKSFQPIEMLLVALFIIYIVFPIETPDAVAGMIDSPLGIIVLLAVTVYLFVYVNPILGVLYIFVAYELIRRSSAVTARVQIIQNTPSQANKDIELKAMNPVQPQTLEEEIVQERAPIGVSHRFSEVDTNFAPVADKTSHGMSSYVGL